MQFRIMLHKCLMRTEVQSRRLLDLEDTQEVFQCVMLNIKLFTRKLHRAQTRCRSETKFSEALNLFTIRRTYV